MITIRIPKNKRNNVLRNRFSKEEIKKIRKKFLFREEINEYLKGL